MHDLWANSSGQVKPTSLDAMTVKYGDVLANFHCMGKNIYQVLQQPTTTTRTTTTTTTTRPTARATTTRELKNMIKPTDRTKHTHRWSSG